MQYGIHWFRRDLRVAGNISLQQQFSKFGGKVVGVFFFDKKFLSREDFSANRFQVFLNTLQSLKNEMKIIGSDLLFFDNGPEQGFELLFDELRRAKQTRPDCISWSRDYEPFSIERDRKIHLMMDELNIEIFTNRDHLIIEPSELAKNDGSPYKVFTPFSRKWIEIFQEDKVQARMKNQNAGFAYLNNYKKKDTTKVFNLTWDTIFNGSRPIIDHLDDYIKNNSSKTDIDIPEINSSSAFEHLKLFKKKLDQYGGLRDFPSIKGTSRLSMYLKNGSLTTAQIVAYLDLKPYIKKSKGQDIYFSELIWREFYYHIMYRFPHVETEPFNEKYKNLQWSNNKKWFEKWKSGNTGFPIVDAGMRELKTTGWMHNRVRMIVASFLTKDLLIDWRWGEKYFMNTLLDGDLAPNNGGWQWAASTGCDAQPYFRIFNPWLQGKRFDLEGQYIKKYIPELKGLSSKCLHKPILDHPIYPSPIVDHSVQRVLALKLYKEI